MSACVYPITRRVSPDRPCGKPGRSFRIVIGGRDLSGAYCPKHTEDVITYLTALGMDLAARTGRKRRALYQADSGALFSMAEARDWLIEQGRRAGVSAGRISKEELAEYAAAH